MLLTINPMLQVPNRHAVRRTNFANHSNLRDSLVCFIHSTAQKISPTCDAWSLRANRGCMAVTIHCVDMDRTPQITILGLVLVKTPCIGETPFVTLH